MHTPDTARLRYLADSQAASMVFRLPKRKSPMEQQIKVLLIFANPGNLEQPDNASPLRTGREDRIIQEAIKFGRYRDNITLTIHHAATIHDLRRALLEDEYHLVHISSHGTNKGLVLENEAGQACTIPPSALAEQLQAYRATLRCVLLNACYSTHQGHLISLGIPYTISMDGTVHDKAAIEFSRGFYDAIGAGKDVDFAYEEGRRNVALTAPQAAFQSLLLKG
jgi:hypothetical protein